MLRIGHKGADAIVAGNTLDSFAAAVEAGCDVIELDVLRPAGDFAAGGDWRRAPPGPAEGTGPLLVAHDWGDARDREAPTLAEALDAFAASPLEHVRFNLDLKIAGREDEVIEALRERRLIERAMVSTMEIDSVAYLRDAAPGLDRGWTLPKVSRDWARSRTLRPVYVLGAATLRARLPTIVRRRAPALGVWAVWIYQTLITRSLVEAAHGEGVAVIAWTVDDPARAATLAALGVDGICSNDPRILADL